MGNLYALLIPLPLALIIEHSAALFNIIFVKITHSIFYHDKARLLHKEISYYLAEFHSIRKADLVEKKHVLYRKKVFVMVQVTAVVYM